MSIVLLEQDVAEAPHWSKAEYEAMVHGAGESSGLRRCLLVAEAAKGVVGFAVGKVVASELGELESVVVRPDARRAGLGKKLCRAVIDWCRGQGAAAVELEVRSASAGARALYADIGFVDEGVRRRYYRDPDDDAVLMRIRF